MTRLRFSQVVGQDEAKLALLLAACEPHLGGVLLRGHKGTGKTTLARGLADLLPGEAPFVELPLGATEDRVIGTIDTAALLVEGAARVRPGLLADAHGGVLYVDEINLLAPHLVDALLDAAASGEHRIERDGISHSHPARFVLVGSMNPEEGDLRPQLLDRFGLAVDLSASLDVAERSIAVRRQLVAEQAPGTATSTASSDGDLRRRLGQHQRAEIPDDVLQVACAVAVAARVEGLRADLMLCRAASALAGWESRTTATMADVQRVAPLVLAHRARRDPFEQSGVNADDLQEWFDRAESSLDDGSAGPEPGLPDDSPDPSSERSPDGGPSADSPEERRVRLGVGRSPRAGFSGRGAYGPGRTGRFLRAEDHRQGDPVAPLPTALALAERRANQPDATLAPADLRAARRDELLGTLVIIAVDTSSSMGAQQRIDEARAAVLGLLTDAYQRRDRVALVTFGGEQAQLKLRPTASVEVARGRLAEVAAAGGTPLADAIDQVVDVLQGRTGDQVADAVVVLITDGRATVGGADPVEASTQAARRLAATGSQVVVVDAEAGRARLGLCGPLAEALGADLVTLDAVAGGGLEQLVRGRLRRDGR
jgi:magnesium chelatase subunit D